MLEFIIAKENFFDFIYNDLIKQFPSSETKSYEKLLSLIKGNNYKAWLICDKDTVVGYCLIFEYSNYILVDYIAILKGFHSKGYGSSFLKALHTLYPDKDGCFFEVEKIDNKNINTVKRANFYTNNNVNIINNIKYIYPNNNGGLPMDLYYQNFNKHIPNKEDIKNFIYNLFYTVHNDIQDLDKIYNKIT